MITNDYCNYNQLQYYLNKQGVENNTDFLRWVKSIMNTKVEMFRYKNLPNGLDNKIIEKALLFNNFLCWWYKEELGGLILCRYICDSDFNMYWLPKRVTLLTLSGITIANNIPFEDIILCRDNTLDIIPFITIKSWLDKIIEVEKTIDINLRISRFPLILKGEKSETAQLKQLIKKMYQCDGIVIGSRDLTGRLESNDIHLPTKLNELYDLEMKYKQLCLESIGIYSQGDKRERLITGEVSANNDYVNFVYTGMRDERKDWIDKVNNKWGLDIKLVETYDTNALEEIELEKIENQALNDNSGVKNNE